MKKYLFFLTALATLLISCKKEIIYPLAESIEFDDTSIQVVEGESKYIYYTILPQEVGDTATVYFSSADESVATVSDWGTVVGVKEGNTTVTATVHGKSATLEVEVIQPVITKFQLTYNDQPLPEVLNIPYGDSAVYIDITEIKPSTASIDGITVSSKNKKIAEAKRKDNQVVITPKEEGETTIIVRGGEVKKEIKINVQMIHAESVVIDQTNPQLGLNTTMQLTATTTPVDISLPQRTWSSSNSNIVEVDPETGKISGKADGTATITVTVDGKSASCQVKVLYVKPTSVTIIPSSKTLVLNDELQLKLTTSPAEVTYPEVTWSSSNSSIVSVDENGLIKGKALGTATISAKVDGVVGTSIITVSKYPPITGYDLVASATQVDIKESITLSIKNLQPSGASFEDIKWSIDNTSLASISVNKNTGVCTLTAKEAAGYVTVTAESNGIVKKQKIQIVKVAVKSITLTSNGVKNSKSEYATWAPTSSWAYAETGYQSDEDIEIIATISPSNASLADEITFTVTPNDSKVQVVNVSGKNKIYVDATASGYYDIKATCDGVTGNYRLYVIPKSFSPYMPAYYGNPTSAGTYGIDDGCTDLDYHYVSSIIDNVTVTPKTQTYTTLSAGNKGIKFDCKDLEYSTNKNVDKVDVSYTVLGKKFSQTVSFYNTYYGMSADSPATNIINDSDTDYKYYIQEGKKTSGCELIGYNTPKFRFKTSGRVLDQRYTYKIYIHYYNPELTPEKVGNCTASTRVLVTSGTVTLGSDTQTFTLPETENMKFKVDFYY